MSRWATPTHEWSVLDSATETFKLFSTHKAVFALLMSKHLCVYKMVRKLTAIMLAAPPGDLDGGDSAL
jgi:hypothetical protein